MQERQLNFQAVFEAVGCIGPYHTVMPKSLDCFPVQGDITQGCAKSIGGTEGQTDGCNPVAGAQKYYTLV